MKVKDLILVNMEVTCDQHIDPSAFDNNNNTILMPVTERHIYIYIYIYRERERERERCSAINSKEI